jgi:Dolichyl-phosphate-mannose-protein mannosyltransferase
MIDERGPWYARWSGSGPRIAVALFVGALALRLCAVLVLGDPAHPQMWEHGEIARNLYHGHGFAMHWPYTTLDPERRLLMNEPPRWEGAWQPPLGPYPIYFAFLAFGDTARAALLLMFANALLGALTCVLIYATSRLLTGETEARLSGLVSVLFLPSIYAVTTYSGSSLSQLLVVVVLYFVLRAVLRPDLRAFAFLGLATGLLALSRSEFLFLGVALAIYAATISLRRVGVARAAGMALVTLATASAVVLPWAARNYQLFGEPVAVISRPWHEVWRGNNALSIGSTFDASGQEIWVERGRFRNISEQLDAIPYDQKFEVRANRVFKASALEFIRDHPGRALSLFLRRVVFVWTFDYHYPPARNPAFVASVLFVTLCFWMGFLELVRRGRAVGDYAPSGVFLLYAAFYTFVFAITFVLPRYQAYFLTGLLPVTGMAWGLLRPAWRLRASGRAVPAH